MKKVHFRRHGVAHWLEIRDKDFYVSAQPHRDKGYYVEICYPESWPVISKRGQIAFSNDASTLYSDLSTARTVIAREIKRIFNLAIEIEDYIEAYMYYDNWTIKDRPYLKNDVYFNVQARYEEGSNTVRKVPENYCLIAWEGSVWDFQTGKMTTGDLNSPKFDVDAATLPWRSICEQAHNEFVKSHNQRNSDKENKEWLAWLISEYIKDNDLDTKSRNAQITLFAS